MEPWKMSLSSQACCTSCGKGIPTSKHRGEQPLQTRTPIGLRLSDSQTDPFTKMYSRTHPEKHTCTRTHMCMRDHTRWHTRVESSTNSPPHQTPILGLCGPRPDSSFHPRPLLGPLQSDICLHHSPETTLAMVMDNLSADSPCWAHSVVSQVSSSSTD